MENTTQTIHAEKHFEKGVQELYNAWINADKLKQWWHPAENKLVHVENNVTEGGTIKYEFEAGESEKTIVITGRYKEVKPAEKLVYSWDWQMPNSKNTGSNNFELTVEFSGDENSSDITITQSDLDENESVHPHQKGWNDELESLHNFLSK